MEPQRFISCKQQLATGPSKSEPSVTFRNKFFSFTVRSC